MRFKDDYFFLSNFFPVKVPLEINGKTIVFQNSEAAFQAQKNIFLADRFSLLSGLEAKKLGKEIPILTNDWNHYQLYAMAKVLRVKFSNEYLLFMLKLIKIDIEETNYWGDTFWGVCKGEGKNILGKMLMNIRDNNNDYEKLLEYIDKELIKNV